MSVDCRIEIVMDDDLLRPQVRIALGLAIMAAAVALGLAAVITPDESFRYFATVGIFAFTLALGFGLGWPFGIHAAIALEAGRLARARMGEDIARHEKAAAVYKHEQALIGRGIGVPADIELAEVPTSVIENAPKYKAEWDSYWLEALEYARAVGSIGYQKMKAFFGGDVVVWRENFAKPFIRAGFVRPIQPGVETTFEDAWSLDKVKWRIEAGTGPAPLPWPPPVAFSGRSAFGTAENGPEMRETVAQTVEQAAT